MLRGPPQTQSRAKGMGRGGWLGESVVFVSGWGGAGRGGGCVGEGGGGLSESTPKYRRSPWDRHI